LQSKYHRLVVQGANTLSATWSTHLPLNATTLPTLPYIEWNILKDTQTFPDNITLDMLRTVNPYLPEHNARQALNALVEKGVLHTVNDHYYYFSEHTRCFIGEVEQALQYAAQCTQTLTPQQATRLLQLTNLLIDNIGCATSPVPTPIFNMAMNAMTPSEHPLPQIQQRLFALQTYYEDAFIGAWKAELYTPASVRLAGYMLLHPAGLALHHFLTIPAFHDEKYVRGGIGTLIERGDALDTGIGFSLTARGVFHRQRVDTIAEQHFVWAFENALSEVERREWLDLMVSLVGNQFN
jgi:hypothetical protein